MPAADEVWRLQQDDDPECRFFRARVTGKPELHRGSLQGTYIFAPSGELLARRNTNSAAHVIDMMKRALAKWEAMPRERRRPTTKNFRPKFRWENNYPKGGLALERIARDLPRDGQWSHKPAAPFNRDGVWFSAAEARLWLPAKLEAGARHEVPYEKSNTSSGACRPLGGKRRMRRPIGPSWMPTP